MSVEQSHGAAPSVFFIYFLFNGGESCPALCYACDEKYKLYLEIKTVYLEWSSYSKHYWVLLKVCGRLYILNGWIQTAVIHDCRARGSEAKVDHPARTICWVNFLLSQSRWARLERMRERERERLYVQPITSIHTFGCCALQFGLRYSPGISFIVTTF